MAGESQPRTVPRKTKNLLHVCTCKYFSEIETIFENTVATESRIMIKTGVKKIVRLSLSAERYIFGMNGVELAAPSIR